LILIAVLVGAAYMLTREPDPVTAKKDPSPQKQDSPKQAELPRALEREPVEKGAIAKAPPRARRVVVRPTVIDQSDVVSADFGYHDPEDEDTTRHIEQTQNLLRSIRNVQVNDGDQDIDVSYDKAVSRRLLNENIVLRRDAEMKSKYPTKALLSDLEPFLIDIANLPDQAKPDDVRAIKERVQKKEIVAALIGY
jgi:hypothetical protein